MNAEASVLNGTRKSKANHNATVYILFQKELPKGVVTTNAPKNLLPFPGKHLWWIQTFHLFWDVSLGQLLRRTPVNSCFWFPVYVVYRSTIVQSRFKLRLFALHVFFKKSFDKITTAISSTYKFFVYIKFFVHKFLWNWQSFILCWKLLRQKCSTYVVGYCFIKICSLTGG